MRKSTISELVLPSLSRQARLKSRAEGSELPEGAFCELGSLATAEDAVTDLCREGARQMLEAALQFEVAEHLARFAHLRDEQGRQALVRNGRHQERTLWTGVGALAVRPPRVADRRPRAQQDDTERFSSRILPPYLRKTKSLEELIPWLYLRGISTGDFPQALQALLGENAKGLSATTVTRLKASWEEDHQQWMKRSLAAKPYVYLFVDGIYPRIRLGEGAKPCLLVIIGVTADGVKEPVAIQDGERESTQSWRELLVDLKSRGLTAAKLAIGDGALGFWGALAEQFPTTRTQRCWVHKTANVLNQLPKSEHAHAKSKLHEIWQASTRAEAEKAFDVFISTYEHKHPKATACLSKDREQLLAFYDFPAEHWQHIRTTNPIESTFATVRLRTSRTKGHGTRLAAITMAFKLIECAAKNWRRFKGHAEIPEVLKGTTFKDGLKQSTNAA